MRLAKTADGKRVLKITRAEWQAVGARAGWARKAAAWSVSDTKDAKHLGPLEFQSRDGEWHNFEVLELPDRLVFGGAVNVGFLESGYILRQEGESTDELLREMMEDLETFYNDGSQYTTRIVVNERM